VKKCFAVIGAASAFGLILVSAAAAAPATSADLAGKKICWDNGSASSYGAGGHYSNNMTGEGTWSVGGGGLHIHTDRYDYMAKVDKLPDGSFTAIILGAGIKSTGKYCR
jgi:hypothetical protein